MPPPDLHTASIVEVRRLVMRLVALKDKWPSEQSLSSLSPRMINSLLAYNNSVGRGYFLQRIVFIFTCGMLLWLWTVTHSFPCMLTFAVPIGLYWTHSNHASHGCRFGIYALTQTNDLRVLPVLLRATKYRWGEHPEVLRALSRLLAQVTEADIGLLSGNLHLRLWRVAVPQLWGGKCVDETFTLNALKAFATIGNRAELLQLRRISEAPHAFAQHPHLVTAAQELVPIMEARLQRQEVPATLLRASQIGKATPDTLLRAHAAPASSPPEQLLRAGRSEPDETGV